MKGLTGVIAVAADYCHTVALKGDGTVWTWGKAGYTPARIKGLSGVVAIAGSLALKADGTVWAWTSSSTPEQIKGLSGVAAIAAGENHYVALKEGGTVWTWGHNLFGKLGDNTTRARTIPGQVAGLSGVVAVAVTYSATLAIKDNGTVWAWGQWSWE